MEYKTFLNITLKTINNMFVSPNEKIIVVLENEGLLKLYNIDSEKITILDATIENENIDLCFSSDNKYIFYYFKGALHVYDICNEKKRVKKFDKTITCFCENSENGEIAVCFLNGKIDVYNINFETKYDYFETKYTFQRNNYCDYMKYEKNILIVIDIEGIQKWDMGVMIENIYFKDFLHGKIILKRPLYVSGNFNFLSFKNNNFLYVVDLKNKKLLLDLKDKDYSILNFSRENFLSYKKMDKIYIYDLKKLKSYIVCKEIKDFNYIGLFSSTESNIYVTNNTSRSIICYDCSYIHRKEKQKVAFLLGIGSEKSHVKNFLKDVYCDDKNLTKLIFDYLP
jgi:WD40 repeat protein